MADNIQKMTDAAPMGHPTAEMSGQSKSHPRPASIGSGGTEVLADKLDMSTSTSNAQTSSYHTSSGGGHTSMADKGSPASVPNPEDINRGYRDNSQGIFPTANPGASRQKLGSRATGPSKGR